MKLNKKLSKEYKEKGATAIMPITNDFSAKIYDIIFGIDDYVVWEWGNEDTLNKSKLRYNNEGECHFRIRHTWYSIDECIQVDVDYR